MVRTHQSCVRAFLLSCLLQKLPAKFVNIYDVIAITNKGVNLKKLIEFNKGNNFVTFFMLKIFNEIMEDLMAGKIDCISYINENRI